MPERFNDVPSELPDGELERMDDGTNLDAMDVSMCCPAAGESYTTLTLGERIENAWHGLTGFGEHHEPSPMTAPDGGPMGCLVTPEDEARSRAQAEAAKQKPDGPSLWERFAG